MNEQKVREVLDYCHKKAQEALNYTAASAAENREYVKYRTLLEIEAKIEELTNEDVGEE